MTNRLREATSPYLLQHADNPVDWWEWEPAAFEEARRRGVPVLLSVGYAACHWCHVMAHESFEDEEVAAYLNEHFVAVKVDREERPDVDAVYMQATTSMTGHGGWPMTCVLDHDGNPFFAGTYFPDQPRHGQPSFRQVLEALTAAWRDRPDDVRRAATGIREHLDKLAGASFAGSFTPELLGAAVDALAADFDPVNGGFGGAPKFPPSMVLEFLRRVSPVVEEVAQQPSLSVVEEVAQQPSLSVVEEVAQQPSLSVVEEVAQQPSLSVVEEVAQQPSRNPLAQQMLDATLTRMARGGIHDQLGGGFSRYSVDAGWVVPHFEKMLYDNALLLRLYAEWGTRAGVQAAEGIADFLLGELRTPEGGFASALDADSEGEEGTYYVWTPQQLLDVLGPEDGPWAARLLEVTESGTFEHGSSTLQLREDPDDLDRWARVRDRLLEARSRRVRPERDDKVVAAWNGLAISGLCRAGRLLGRPAYVEAAVAAGELLWRIHVVGGHLRRVSRDGVVGAPAGVLEDHGCVAAGFLDLAGVTGGVRWLDRARALLDVALAEFRSDDGGFFDTAADAEVLVSRPRDPADNASPSGLSATVHALVDAHAMTGHGPYRQAAEEALASVAGLAERAPRFAGWSLAATAAVLGGPLEIAVVGPPGPARDALEQRALRHPGAVVVAAEPGSAIPLMEGREPIEGAPAAYVCRGFVCERPVTTVEELDLRLA